MENKTKNFYLLHCLSSNENGVDSPLLWRENLGFGIPLCALSKICLDEVYFVGHGGTCVATKKGQVKEL